MASTISAGTTTTTALVYSADTSGVLQLQTNGGTTAVTIDTSQNVGVGITPNAWSGFTAFQMANGVGLSGASGSSNTQLTSNAYFNGSAWTYIANAYATKYTQVSGQHQWFNAPSSTGAITFTQAMTLDSSGNLLVGATSQTQGGKIFSSFNQSTNQGITLQNTNSSNSAYFVYMLNSAGNAAGSITQSGATSVNYGTGSDYRLKENIQPMTGALAKVNQLNPVTFDWIADKTQGQGFIAHELQAVVPECVYGEKDAVDSEGNLKYQMVDQSKLVGVLTAAIQELAAQVTTLQTQVTALKG